MSLYYIFYSIFIIPSMYGSSSPLPQLSLDNQKQNIDLSNQFLNFLRDNNNLFCCSCRKFIHLQKFIYTQCKIYCIGCFSKQQPNQKQKLFINLGVQSPSIQTWTLYQELQLILQVQENYRNGIYPYTNNSTYKQQQSDKNLQQQHYINEIWLKNSHIDIDQQDYLVKSQKFIIKNPQKIIKYMNVFKKDEINSQLRRIGQDLQQADDDLIGNHMIAYIKQTSSHKDRELAIQFLKHKNIKKAKRNNRIKRLLSKCKKNKAQINKQMKVKLATTEYYDGDGMQSFKMRQIIQQSNKLQAIYDQFMQKVQPQIISKEVQIRKSSRKTEKHQNYKKLSLGQSQNVLRSKIIQSQFEKIKIKIKQIQQRT